MFWILTLLVILYTAFGKMGHNIIGDNKIDIIILYIKICSWKFE